MVPNPRKLIIGGFLFILLVLAMGFLIGYYTGHNVCEGYYLDKIIEIRAQVLPFTPIWGG